MFIVQYDYRGAVIVFYAFKRQGTPGGNSRAENDDALISNRQEQRARISKTDRSL